MIAHNTKTSAQMPKKGHRAANLSANIFILYSPAGSKSYGKQVHTCPLLSQQKLSLKKTSHPFRVKKSPVIEGSTEKQKLHEMSQDFNYNLKLICCFKLL